MPDSDFHDLYDNLSLLHTTPLGAGRIRKNLGLDENEDPVAYCLEILLHPRCRIESNGKNWYASIGDTYVTINRSRMTLITAHIRSSKPVIQISSQAAQERTEDMTPAAVLPVSSKKKPKQQQMPKKSAAIWPEDIFHGLIPDWSKLRQNGFHPINETGQGTGKQDPDQQDQKDEPKEALTGTWQIKNGEFLLSLRVNLDGSVCCRLVDARTEEDYIPFRLIGAGKYAASVKEEARTILENTAQTCFHIGWVYDSQTLRLLEQLETHDVHPEFLWKKDRLSCVFRHPDTLKWFGILMHIRKDQLAESESNEAESEQPAIPGNQNKKTRAARRRRNADPFQIVDCAVESCLSIEDQTPKVDILNVKASPERVAQLLKEPGIYPAYHMNKNHWISILLDDTVSDKMIHSLLSDSWNLIS